MAVLFGLAGEASGQKPLKRPAGPKRFVDAWSNPNVPTELVLRGDGAFAQVRRDGTVGADGMWQVTGATTVTLFTPASRATCQATLVNDSLIVLQHFLPDGGSEGDGTVLFRKGYDWSGKNANKVVADKKANALIAGKWSHPNSQRIFAADNQGEWIETRKNGGEPIAGTWSACDDGTFWVEYSHGGKMRAWASADGRLALQAFSGATGEMIDDGMTVVRTK